MMNAIAVPVLESKVDAWKAWVLECTGPRREEFDRFDERTWNPSQETSPSRPAQHLAGPDPGWPQRAVGQRDEQDA